MQEKKKSLTSKHKVKIGAASILTGALLVTGSLAFFTDKYESTVMATAGTVDLELTSNWQDVSNFNPGDIADLSYEISSVGNKSIDVREKLVVKSTQPMTSTGQAEFEIYNKSDVTQNNDGMYVPNTGAESVASGADRVISTDNTSITYVLDEYTLNGTGTNAEAEDGITETQKESEYVLVFNTEASNDYQGIDVTVDLLAEAKQHRNTNSDTWTEVATESIIIGGETVNAVPSRN